jgi:hypothetical protein
MSRKNNHRIALTDKFSIIAAHHDAHVLYNTVCTYFDAFAVGARVAGLTAAHEVVHVVLTLPTVQAFWACSYEPSPNLDFAKLLTSH